MEYNSSSIFMGKSISWEDNSYSTLSCSTRRATAMESVSFLWEIPFHGKTIPTQHYHSRLEGQTQWNLSHFHRIILHMNVILLHMNNPMFNLKVLITFVY
ncbi:unnamed protein product [Rhizophagus irregularis]|uniref:Uncharacterized protein n=1 Tax=Rhizophagus irregularis TaxID=588596 RepID=A0A915ZM01_9GLOM|nr:unnamed protein product [Rhizophagus irregularis]